MNIRQDGVENRDKVYLSKTFIHQEGWLQKRIRPEDNYWWKKRIVSWPLRFLWQDASNVWAPYKAIFSIFLKNIFRLPEFNSYTSTVNIVKPCGIIFFKIFPNNWKGFSFRVVSRISLLTPLFYHSLYYCCRASAGSRPYSWAIWDFWFNGSMVA